VAQNTASSLRLKTFFSTYPHTEALKDGTVKIEGVELDTVEVNPSIAAYRRMVRDTEFDVCELAPTTYLVAKSFGKPFTAIPVFLNHIFHFGDIHVRSDAGIAKPSDLRGKKVGVRAYTVTTGVWTRGILQNEYGVDPADVTWVTDDEEHVQEFKAPPNVVKAPEGTSLQQLLADGGINAAFGGMAGTGRAGAPTAGWDAKNAAPVADVEVRPLFPNAGERDTEWTRRTGIYPIHGLVVVRDELLQQDPSLAGRLYDGFLRAKNLYVDRLQREGAKTDADRKWLKFGEMVQGDPLPYGIGENRRSIDGLINYAHQQGLIPARWRAEDVFAV
jgi:4,5-dihydroxyphthalate decarboxylase